MKQKHTPLPAFKVLSLLLVLLLGQEVLAQSPFLENLTPFCGQHYGGKVIYPEGDKDPFAGKALVIHLNSCTEKQMQIPFHVGEDKSRTWLLSLEHEGLLLKHDHRHADGSPDEVTMYGGYATAAGTPLVQHFPADAHTAKLIPAAATNEWTLQLSEDKKTLSYILKRGGQLRFRADFDLANPLR